ncbi:hypothetical protein [Bradyrhizobium sp. 131]|uniref:hypothetical protein n=1 Tax=Bradyrhizobium sp. 131 TaxID=2782609 RepID=UPI001FFEAA24|nr:hypothetical protein [Bradyrhizobium sp. 131]
MVAFKGVAMGLEGIRNEISYMRRQIGRQQTEIQTLRRADISTASAETLLTRMQAKVEGLCGQRDQLLAEEGLNLKSYASGKRIKGTPAHRRA